MTALRWTRRSLDAILPVALVAVALTARIALLAPVTAGRPAAPALPPPVTARRRPRRMAARAPALVRVREAGRARDPHAPVFLERDRRNPRRHGVATFPGRPAAAPTVAVSRAA